MEMKVESEATLDLPKEETNSPSTDDGSSSGGGLLNGSGGGRPLKKGPWTAAEDAILIDYVENHGEGNWNAVQRNSGLSRCGKSCRLRWANHLRPNLKKGPFTADEEKLIIELHARMGNKWARMAVLLPGRTDNEIKNFWNTRTKRLQRAGLPIYPENLCSQTSNEELHSQNMGELCGKKRPNEFSQGNSFDLPEVIFDNFDYGSTFSTFSPQGMLGPFFGSQNPLSVNAMNPLKQLSVSDSLVPCFGCSLSGEQLPDEPEYSTGYDHLYDLNPGRTKTLAPFGDAINGGHPVLNGNFSTSGPLVGPVKMELPSLQYTNNDPSDNWYNCDAPSPLEQVDTYIQSPMASASVQSECVLPRNSGLLEALVQEGHGLGTMKNQPSAYVSVPIVTPNPIVGSSEFKFSEEHLGQNVELGYPCKEHLAQNNELGYSCKEHLGQHNELSYPCEEHLQQNNRLGYPAGRSSASVLGECTTIGSRSMDELQSSKPSSGINAPLGGCEHFLDTKFDEKQFSTRQEFVRPDMVLGSICLDETPQDTKDHSINDVLSALLSGDSFDECKPITTGDLSGSGLPSGLESFPWKNMPRAWHMSEFPEQL